MNATRVSSIERVHAFLDRLDELGAEYRLGRLRDNALLVEVAVPGEHWEVEFFTDGHVEVERYSSDGTISDESVLPELFAFFSDNP